jgi:hypothetical protein
MNMDGTRSREAGFAASGAWHGPPDSRNEMEWRNDRPLEATVARRLTLTEPKHSRPLPDCQPDQRPVLDGLAEDVLGFFKIAAGVYSTRSTCGRSRGVPKRALCETAATMSAPAE